MTVEQDAKILTTCGAHASERELRAGAYPGGYYPAYIRAAIKEVGKATLIAAVIAERDAEWAHRILCLCHPDRAQSESLLDVIEQSGTANESWYVIFTHGEGMEEERFSRFARLLIRSGDRNLIQCARSCVSRFKTLYESRVVV